MTKREKLCLQMRNRKGQENEIFCRHYQKKFGGYLFHLLFGFHNFSTFIVGLLFTLMAIFLGGAKEDTTTKVILWLTAALVNLLWLYFVIKDLWYWKYTKHVFVTDEGIWIMTCSVFWWSGAPDFMDKRRFWAPSWSLYDWRELKKVSSCNDADDSLSRLNDVFAAIDDFVIRLTKLNTVYLNRWDGIARIDFLSKNDAEEIIDYYKSQKRSRRKAKKDIKEEPISE